MKPKILDNRIDITNLLLLLTAFIAFSQSRLLTSSISDIKFNRKLTHATSQINNLRTRIQMLKDKMQISTDALDFYFDKLINYESDIHKKNNLLEFKKMENKQIKDIEDHHLYPILEKLEAERNIEMSRKTGNKEDAANENSINNN